MNKFFWTILAISVFAINVNAQVKIISAYRTSEKIKIDGVLNEESWTYAAIASDFVGFYPVFGNKPAQNTEVKVIFNDHSIYFSAVMYDLKPDSIYNEFTVRDKDNGNADYFGISLNPNNDGQSTFEFMVSAANVQTDIRVSDENDDYAWDAVWHSETKITEDGWVVEIEIPYSAIRFPKDKEQNWAVNFYRTVRRSREKSTWMPVDLTQGSEASQMGIITGINDINPPLRLALMPYASGYLNLYDKELGYSFSGGLDLKLGLSETYTLDMTLIPDFGQTKTDELVLNLTPHETYYSENRPFFTEGTELFNKCGLFYSRRIGKTPQDYYSVISGSGTETYSIDKNPATAKLVNAFKISGRGEKNLAIGVFNAVTANTYAKVTDIDGMPRNILTEPAANYNILVLDQSIGKNSFVNLTNASVVRPGNSYLSNVTATSFKLMEKTNKFGISTLAAYSSQRNKNEYLADGWYLNSSIGKMTGTWIYSLGTELITDKYNPNDLGYMTEFNQISNTASLGFRKFSQFSVFNETINSLSISYNTLFKDLSFTQAEIFLENYATTKKHLSIWNDITFPLTDLNDYYEPRDGISFYKRPALYSEYLFISTDYRKKIAVDFRVSLYGDIEDRQGIWGSISPIIRFGKRTSLRYTFSGDIDNGAAGYFSNTGNNIIFGQRDVITITNSIDLSYVFTNKLSTTFELRHYVSSVDYYKYFDLMSDGSLSERTDYQLEGDYNFNIFNFDLLLSWNFLPGSYLSVMWKNQIFASGNIPESIQMPGYFDSFKNVWAEPQANTFSIKLIYYLDYSSLRTK
ncbi:MAG TPA: DUF5916 domain-containing protein [Bacteroidales bacterium]|nr:DUF5916 domain-containing protein [Bacteroidales bacterium]